MTEPTRIELGKARRALRKLGEEPSEARIREIVFSLRSQGIVLTAHSSRYLAKILQIATPPSPQPSGRLQRNFWRFHYANPDVYNLLCRFADQWIATGHTWCGMRMIYERVRWEIAITTTDPEFKLNDHHAPYYARLWMLDHPGYPEFFELRKVQGDSLGKFRFISAEEVASWGEA